LCLGVSETHRRGTEELVLNGYKFVAQGTEEGAHRSGVGLLLNKTAQKAFQGYNPVSDRIICVKFQTMVGYLVVIQVYAPTADAAAEDIEAFYCLLQTAVSEQRDASFLVVMGNYNAKVGTDWDNAGGALGKFGTGDLNKAGERLIQFVNANRFEIANTCFKQVKASRLWTWESPGGRTRNMIDHILVSSKWRGSITNARVYPSADVGSDHQLIAASIRLKL